MSRFHQSKRVCFENDAAIPPRRGGQQFHQLAAWSAAFMLALMLAGCGDPERDKIVGTWEIESANRIASRLKEAKEDSSNNNDNRMSVEFRSNGVLKTQTLMGTLHGQKEGTWTLMSFDEPSSTMRLKCVLEQQETEQEIEFLDEDTIQMVPPNMAGLEMKLRFKRAGRRTGN
jgi:hypothetical protein